MTPQHTTRTYNQNIQPDYQMIFSFVVYVAPVIFTLLFWALWLVGLIVVIASSYFYYLYRSNPRVLMMVSMLQSAVNRQQPSATPAPSQTPMDRTNDANDKGGAEVAPTSLIADLAGLKMQPPKRRPVTKCSRAIVVTRGGATDAWTDVTARINSGELNVISVKFGPDAICYIRRGESLYQRHVLEPNNNPGILSSMGFDVLLSDEDITRERIYDRFPALMCYNDKTE
jgi:hypothetical protein